MKVLPSLRSSFTTASFSCASFPRCKLSTTQQQYYYSLSPSLLPQSLFSHVIAIGALFPSRTFASKTHYWANQSPSDYPDEVVHGWVKQFPHLQAYDLKDLKKWRNAFETYDHDSDGFISPADLAKNPNLPLEKLKLLKEYDRDQNNLIDFGEFVDAISSLDVIDIRRKFAGFDPVDILLEFEKFAVHMDGDSRKVMDLRQLIKLMQYCECICVTEKDAARLLAEVDVGNDGAIDFDEFNNIYKIGEQHTHFSRPKEGKGRMMTLLEECHKRATVNNCPNSNVITRSVSARVSGEDKDMSAPSQRSQALTVGSFTGACLPAESVCRRSTEKLKPTVETASPPSVRDSIKAFEKKVVQVRQRQNLVHSRSWGRADSSTRDPSPLGSPIEQQKKRLQKKDAAEGVRSEIQAAVIDLSERSSNGAARRYAAEDVAHSSSANPELRKSVLGRQRNMILDNSPSLGNSNNVHTDANCNNVHTDANSNNLHIDAPKTRLPEHTVYSGKAAAFSESTIHSTPTAPEINKNVRVVQKLEKKSDSASKTMFASIRAAAFKVAGASVNLSEEDSSVSDDSKCSPSKLHKKQLKNSNETRNAANDGSSESDKLETRERQNMTANLRKCSRTELEGMIQRTHRSVQCLTNVVEEIKQEGIDLASRNEILAKLIEDAIKTAGQSEMLSHMQKNNSAELQNILDTSVFLIEKASDEMLPQVKNLMGSLLTGMNNIVKEPNSNSSSPHKSTPQHLLGKLNGQYRSWQKCSSPSQLDSASGLIPSEVRLSSTRNLSGCAAEASLVAARGNNNISRRCDSGSQPSREGSTARDVHIADDSQRQLLSKSSQHVSVIMDDEHVAEEEIVLFSPHDEQAHYQKTMLKGQSAKPQGTVTHPSRSISKRVLMASENDWIKLQQSSSNMSQLKAGVGSLNLPARVESQLDFTKTSNTAVATTASSLEDSSLESFSCLARALAAKGGLNCSPIVVAGMEKSKSIVSVSNPTVEQQRPAAAGFGATTSSSSSQAVKNTETDDDNGFEFRGEEDGSYTSLSPQQTVILDVKLVVDIPSLKQGTLSFYVQATETISECVERLHSKLPFPTEQLKQSLISHLEGIEDSAVSFPMKAEVKLSQLRS